MATIAPGLNFRIGADVKGINKAIREAEKSLRGAVSSFSSIGNSLSIALSAPLAAFGAMAVKTAGEMESLRFALEGTMKDAGRSTAEAAMEMEALRKAALAPGLDFEQAVRGSVRLQSVGKSAEEARRILVQLANALALSGGSADQLDGVTRQFTQMIGKGKLMQEDLTIILENMPALAKVMNDTWGTSNAERLRNMGVGVEEFLEKLTTGMEKLPRAQGGIANAIVNAQNAIRQALASVGEELNKTFGISDKLNSFSDWVSNLATAFKNLDDGTKRLIVGVGVFALALGPAFKLMQAGVWITGKLHIAFLGLQKLLAQSMAGQAIPSLIGKWRALDFAMKASVIGGIAAVVLAAAAAFAVMSKDMSAAAQAARTVDAVTKEANSSVAAQRVEIELLTSVVKDSNSTHDQRRAALDKLIAISPDYRKALKGEAIDTVELDKVTSRLISTMVRAATVKAATDKIAELRTKMADLKEESEPSFWQTTGNALLSMGNMSSFMGMQVETTTKNIVEQKAAMEAQIKSLEELAKANLDVAPAIETTTVKTNENTEAAKKNAEAIKKAVEAIKMPRMESIDQSQPSISPIFDSQGLKDAMVSASTVGATIVTALTPAQAMLKAVNMDMMDFGEIFDMVAKDMMENGNVFEQIGFGLTEALVGIADAGGGLEEMAGGIVKSLKKIVGGLIKTGVTAIVTKALLSSALNPFAALALGAASGALAQGLFNSLINKIKVPGLAEGGVLHSPRLVMAGEYPGAMSNPEIVTPENKMRDVVGEMLQKFGGVNGGVLTCRVTGDDLLFVLEKAQVKSARKR